MKLSPPLRAPDGRRLNAAAPGPGGAVLPWEVRPPLDDAAVTTALVHDFLAQAGGAERVVAALHALFPSAPLYTSVYDPNGHVGRVWRRRRVSWDDRMLSGPAGRKRPLFRPWSWPA